MFELKQFKDIIDHKIDAMACRNKAELHKLVDSAYMQMLEEQVSAALDLAFDDVPF